MILDLKEEYVSNDVLVVNVLIMLEMQKLLHHFLSSYSLYPENEWPVHVET